MTDKRIGIEVIRITAVVAVVLYHLHPEIFPNGYLGVDAFFVVSGYLVRGLLERESLRSFYHRRFMRLAPAALSVVLLVVILSLAIDPPYITKDLGQAALAHSAYATNILYYFKLDYFNPFHEQSPLRHLWSLSLEEQFYFALPLIVLTIPQRFTNWILALFGLFSLIIYLKPEDPLYAFYMPHTRAWELLLGVGLYQAQLPNLRLGHLSVIPLTAALLLKVPAPISMTAVLVSTSILIHTEWNRPRWRWALTFGAFSYSLYLVHQPIVYYLQQNLGTGIPTTALIILLSLAFAWAVHRFIEQPFRKDFRLKTLLIVLSTSALTAGLGGYLHLTDGGWPIKQYVYDLPKTDPNQRNDLFTQRSERCDELMHAHVSMADVVLIGDSKAEDLRMAIHAYTGKVPYLNTVKAWEYHPDLLNESTLNQKLLDPRTRAVLISNTWSRTEPNRLNEFIRRIHVQAPQIKIYVLSTANYRDVSSQYYELIKAHADTVRIQKQLGQERPNRLIKESNTVKNAIASLDFPVQWIQKEEAFSIPNSQRTKLLYQGNLMIYDSGHLTVNGAAYFGSWICSKIPELNPSQAH
jgi:peptidoglycan/LPS O-acetylase OafA/YrhL